MEYARHVKMLIARVHLFMEVRRVRGAQYKYTGHVINFLRETTRVYAKLPLLPHDLDVVVLRPANANTDGRPRRQFMRDFRVRVAPIRQWLIHLKRHHLGYRDIDIDDDALRQLEELSHENDGSIIEHFVSQTDPVSDGPADGADDDEDVLAVMAAVPDLLPNNQGIDEIRRGINGRIGDASLAQPQCAGSTVRVGV
jgi:hypothetical protein